MTILIILISSLTQQQQYHKGGKKAQRRLKLKLYDLTGLPLPLFRSIKLFSQHTIKFRHINESSPLYDL